MAGGNWNRATPGGNQRGNLKMGGHRGFTPAPTPGLQRSNVSQGQHRAEHEALQLIKLQREQNMRFMFAGAKVQFKVAAGLTAAKSVASGGKTVYSNAQKIGSGIGKTTKHIGQQFTTAHTAVGKSPMAVKDFLKDVLNVKSLAEVKDVIPQSEMTKLISDITPFVGTVSSGVNMLKSWGQTAQMAYKQYQTKNRIQALLAGDPAAAGRALRRMLQEETAKYAADGAINTTKFALSTASLPADGGATANLALSMVSLAKTLFEIGWDVYVMKMGNLHLRNPNTLDLKVFDDCPLLGCYLLVNSNTSDVVNLLLEEIGQPGWMGDVERMVKESISPMISDANSLIVKSRLEVANFRGNNKIDNRSGLQKMAHKVNPQAYNARKNKWEQFKKNTRNTFKRK